MEFISYNDPYEIRVELRLGLKQLIFLDIVLTIG